jgi:hypothetical protein
VFCRKSDDFPISLALKFAADRIQAKRSGRLSGIRAGTDARVRLSALDRGYWQGNLFHRCFVLLPHFLFRPKPVLFRRTFRATASQPV